MSTNWGLNLKNILCTMCLKGLESHTKPGFYFNVFSDNLYFDGFNLDLSQICKVISQTLGERTL